MIPERNRDVDLFFSENASYAFREKILSKYNVSYILLNKDFIDPEDFDDYCSYGSVIDETQNFRLIDLE
ncbi:MAG: hypothetical protein GF334_00865 [Candidatus Altiarchaeales archaeon]|nr:hypothetical protein [Candidatus Altiarchaeales archaeon]